MVFGRFLDLLVIWYMWQYSKAAKQYYGAKNFHLQLHICSLTSVLPFIWTKSNFSVSGQSDLSFIDSWVLTKDTISFHFSTKPSLIPRFPKSAFFCFYWNVTTKVSLCNCLYRLHIIIIHKFEPSRLFFLYTEIYSEGLFITKPEYFHIVTNKYDFETSFLFQSSLEFKVHILWQPHSRVKKVQRKLANHTAWQRNLPKIITRLEILLQQLNLSEKSKQTFIMTTETKWKGSHRLPWKQNDQLLILGK